MYAARGIGADDAAPQQNDQAGAGEGRIQPELILEIDRQIDGRADEGEHRKEQRARRLADDIVGEDRKRDQRLGRARQMHAEPGREQRELAPSARMGGEVQGYLRPPSVSISISPTLAPIISAEPRMSSRCGRRCCGRSRRMRPQTRIAIAQSGRLIQKISGPGEMLRQKPAEHGTGDARGRPDRRDIDDIFGALARARDVGDDGLRERDQPAAAQALHRAAGDQQRHRGRQRAHHRADEEDQQPADENRAAAVNVGKLAVKRRHGGAGQQIGRDDPGQEVDVAERSRRSSAARARRWSGRASPETSPPARR